VFKTPVFGKYVDPNDIQPGLLSSAQFLSTLSCLAEREENIKRLIENQKTNPNGFYYVRLNINGVGGISPLMITCQNLMENQLVLVALMIISPNYGFRSLRKHMQKSTITIAVLSRLEFQDSIIYVI
jgi:hypothetical protein